MDKHTFGKTEVDIVLADILENDSKYRRKVKRLLSSFAICLQSIQDLPNKCSIRYFAVLATHDYIKRADYIFEGHECLGFIKNALWQRSRDMRRKHGIK